MPVPGFQIRDYSARSDSRKEATVAMDLAQVPVTDRSVKHQVQRYRNLVTELDSGSATYLAEHCRARAIGTPAPGCATTAAQYVAMAAYWQSIAEAQAR